MNRNKLWIHWIPTHDPNPYLNYIAKLQPGGIKIIDPDVTHISRAFEVSPGSIFVLRNHPLSEDKDAIYNNPVETGKRHADWWNTKVREYYAQAAERNLPMPKRENLIVLGGNELAIWAHMVPSVLYNAWFLDELRNKYDLTGGALNLNVGWPGNNGPDTPPDWSPLLQVYEAVRRGRHYFFLHEYWDFRGVDPMWGWHAGRFTKMPWSDVKIVIGEAGVDQHVIDGQGHRGWKHGLNAATYANQVEEYVKRASEDSRFVGACLFSDDYGSKHWESFDSLTAHDALLSKKWYWPGVVKPEPVKKKVRLPFVGEFSITQRFGENPDFYKPFNGHLGVDWATPMNTPVISVDDGIVTEVYDLNQWGKYIKVVHAWGESVYAHLESQSVTINQRVKGGEFIGRTGNTGRSTGPHLHLGIRLYPYSRKDGWDGYIDPLEVVDLKWVTKEPDISVPPEPVDNTPELHQLNLTRPSVVKISTDKKIEIIVNNRHKLTLEI